MGLGGVCHRMVMGYAGASPGEGLRVILTCGSEGATHASHWLRARAAPGPPVSVRGARNRRTQIEPARPGSFLVQLERREASVVSSIPARSPIPKARAAAL
jgi:hypothetical protein